MKQISLLFLISVLSISWLSAQNLDYAGKVINDLSSEKYQGRGYFKHGDRKAARYIENEYHKLGLKSWDDYYQNFSFDVNTQHGNHRITIDGRLLVPGVDFVVREYCRSFEGDFNIYRIDTLKPKETTVQELLALDTSNTFVAVEYAYYVRDSLLLTTVNNMKLRNVMLIFDGPLKRYMAASGSTRAARVIWITDNALGKSPARINARFKSKFVKSYKTGNVIGYIEGSQQPDSFFVITAHYDHMGRFGRDVWYPGANDNLSGVAMLLNLAEYYSKPENKPKCSIAFMAFAAEETGLLGSMNYVQHPFFPLSQVKYVINFDMIADNNPVVYTEVSDNGMRGFEMMKSINSRNKLFEGFDLSELSGNSDHYPFAIEGVPAVFFLDHGEAFKVYHTPLDTLNGESLTLFPSFFNMTEKFIRQY